jgi:hypothetical protein
MKLDRNGPTPQKAPVERILRWESPQRYYAARVRQDLLGDWMISCAWGALNNENGNTQSLPLPTFEAANAAVNIVYERRIKHKYNLVSDRTE